MDDSSVAQPVAPTPKSGRSKKPLLFSLLAIILIAGAAYGAYTWQHKKVVSANNSVASLNTKVTGLNSQLKKLNTQVASLTSQNKQASTTIKNYQAAAGVTQSDLTISIVGSVRYNFMGALNTPNNGVAVEISVKNPTSTDVYLATESLKLKDAQNNSYDVKTEFAQSGLPASYVVLNDQDVAAGETVKGYVVFEVDTLSLQSFSLVNGSNSYPVTVSS